MKDEVKKQSDSNIIGILKLFLLVLAVVLSVFVVWTIQSVHKEESSSVIVVEPAIPIKAESRILLVGEVFWGRYIRDASMASNERYRFPFSGLDTFEREKYDAWLAHMECPITDNNLTSAEQEATLTFNCRPEFLEEASKWFDVMSLANNHTDNMGGQVGLDVTREYLEQYGIQHYGHYDNAVVDELCEVIDLPIQIEYLFGPNETKNLPVAMCGYHNVFKLPTEEELDVISAYSKHFLTIVTPQMGQEYVPVADEFKTDTYRAMIDRGADMVVATHPHWVQNTEVYKGKLIMYSLGNFMFDQQDSEEVRRSAALDLVISMSNSSEISKWTDVNFECDNFGDGCLSQAKKLGLKKPGFTFSYNIVSSLNTGYVTSLAPDDVHSRVLGRLNWPQTIEQLHR